MQIDVAQVLKAKAPGKHIPKWVIRWLKRLIHQDEMNAFLATHEGLTDFDFIDATIHECLGCDATIEGTENLPKTEEPLIFVSNHPLGGLDGMIIALMLHEQGRHPKVIVNDLLLNMQPIAGLFVPVNKVGKQSRAYAEIQQRMWEEGCDVLTFPAGACSRKVSGQIQDLEWKKSFIRHAIQYKRNIVPIYFEGTNSKRFYAIAQWRKRLGIRLNLEMITLVDEMFRARGKHFTVHIGQMIPYTMFDQSRSMNEWAEWVRARVYAHDK